MQEKKNRNQTEKKVKIKGKLKETYKIQQEIWT